MKLKYQKIILYSLLTSVFLLLLGQQMYTNNIYTVRNISMQGLLVNITPDYKIKSINALVNLKFHIAADKIKKPQSIFKFFNKKNEQIFEIKVYENLPGIYHYNLVNTFMAKPRQVDSFMKMFCESWTKQCGITFAFSKDETIYNLPEDIYSVTLDNEKIDSSLVLYDYKNMNDEIAKGATQLTYEYDKTHIKVCTQFDSIKYTEALRITTLDKNNETMQKVCTKEDTNGSCCEIKGDNTQYSKISVLHWKGSWNEGKFVEYGINLK